MKGINLLALLLAVVAVTACSKKNKNGGSAPAAQVQEEKPEKAVLEPQARIITTITPQFSNAQYRAEVKLVNEAGDGYVTYQGYIDLTSNDRLNTLTNIDMKEDTIEVKTDSAQSVWMVIEFGPEGSQNESKRASDSVHYFTRQSQESKEFNFAFSFERVNLQDIMADYKARIALFGSESSAVMNWDKYVEVEKTSPELIAMGKDKKQ